MASPQCDVPSIQKLAPTEYKVYFWERHHERSWSRTVVPIAILIGWLFRFDPKIELEWLWLTIGAVVGLYVFETSSSKHHQRELSVTICPLGVQRSTTLVSAANNRCGQTQYRHRRRHHPFLPRESVQDCIVTEHVGAFSVRTHVMLRVAAAGERAGVSDSLIPAFPNATLTFDQCYSLMKQIQRALKEV
mmetsp:Transcript_2806/g.5320  ORF Transcript_2806/g.5320 Transcript_2806/m.5320 type:complete len:190 (+) Transcript_2806:299-868(+)